MKVENRSEKKFRLGMCKYGSVVEWDGVLYLKAWSAVPGSADLVNIADGSVFRGIANQTQVHRRPAKVVLLPDGGDEGGEYDVDDEGGEG